jgi:hypothetical protein
MARGAKFDLNARYEKVYRHLLGLHPMETDPDKVTISIEGLGSGLSDYTYLELGALSAALGEYSRAGAWFALGLRASLWMVRDTIPMVSRWPHYAWSDRLEALEVDMFNAAMFCRLSNPTPSKVAWIGETREWIVWLSEYCDYVWNRLRETPQVYDAAGPANGYSHRLHKGLLFTALVFGEDTVVQRYPQMASEFRDWMLGVHNDIEHLALKGFVGFSDTDIYCGVVSGRVDLFERALRARTARWRLTNPAEAYIGYCHPEWLALALELWGRTGRFLQAKVKGLPEGFGPDLYWNALEHR